MSLRTESMKPPRKYIRIALAEDDEEPFTKAKARAEEQSGISMSDAMFALSVIRHAIKARSQ